MDDRLVPRVRTFYFIFFHSSHRSPAFARSFDPSKTRRWRDDRGRRRRKSACDIFFSLNRRIITGDFTHTPRFDCATRANRRRRVRVGARWPYTSRDGVRVCLCMYRVAGIVFFFVCVCGDRPGGCDVDDCPMTTASRETVTRSGVARERNARWFLSRVCARINARGRSVGDVNSEDGTRSIEPALARGTRRHGNLDASGVGGSDRR